MYWNLFKFFSSLKLAVISILSLAAVLAAATIYESMYGARGAHVLVYGTWWFAGVLFMLGLNVFCAAMSRYPWKRHQIGFLITHFGILVLLFGSFLTQQYGVDGNLPVVEGSQDGEVILNDLRLIVLDENSGQKRQFPVPEYAVSTQGDVMSVELGNGAKLVVDRMYPRVNAEREITPSPVAGLGTPALNISLYNSRFKVDEWLLSQNPTGTTELNMGPATLSFQQLPTPADEKRFLSATKKTSPLEKDKIGFLVAELRGREYRLPISNMMKSWTPIGETGLNVSVEKYLPFAVVKDNQLVSRSNEPKNPAVQLSVRASNGEQEKHTIFAHYPEFSTLHRAHGDLKRATGVKFRMVASHQAREELAIVGKRRGALEFAQSADGKRLFYKAVGAAGQVNGQGMVTVGKPTNTGWMDLQFVVNKWLPSSVEQQVPRPVDYIGGGSANYLSAVRLRAEVPRQTASEADNYWLFEGMGKVITVGDRRYSVQYMKERLSLPFQVFLEKFTIGTDPGTTKAASYESQVRVKDARNGKDTEGASQKISMNEPMDYGGYTFYQASYQMEDGKPPVSIFSVNFDPGRTIKYLGSLIMVLGIALMFYMNPHYWNKILGQRKGAA